MSSKNELWQILDRMRQSGGKRQVRFSADEAQRLVEKFDALHAACEQAQNWLEKAGEGLDSEHSFNITSRICSNALKG